MKNYPTVVFDVGGTLLHFNLNKLVRVYEDAASARGTALDPTQARAVLERLERELPTRSRERELSLETDFGKAFWDEFYAEGFRRLGVNGDVSAVVAKIRERFQRGEFDTLYADTLPALDALAARGVPLGILSNFSPNLEDVLRQLGIHDHFNFFVVSAIAGVEKPDPKIFALAARAANRPREEIVYVGDSVFHDVEGARGAGIAAILIDRAHQFSEHDGARVENLRDVILLLERESHAVEA
jgi:REG-2-like HAD superfamily hydrolase